jgi:acyl-homoserine lactone acylase PvdQ
MLDGVPFFYSGQTNKLHFAFSTPKIDSCDYYVEEVNFTKGVYLVDGK